MDNNKLLLFVIILLVAFFALSNRPTGNVVVSDQDYASYMRSPDNVDNYDEIVTPIETPYYEPQQKSHCDIFNRPEFKDRILQKLRELQMPQGYIAQIIEDLDSCDETGLDESQRALVDGILDQYLSLRAGDVA